MVEQREPAAVRQKRTACGRACGPATKRQAGAGGGPPVRHLADKMPRTADPAFIPGVGRNRSGLRP